MQLVKPFWIKLEEGNAGKPDMKPGKEYLAIAGNEKALHWDIVGEKGTFASVDKNSVAFVDFYKEGENPFPREKVVIDHDQAMPALQNRRKKLD